MASHNIEHLDIKLLKQHILSKASTEPNTITVYHFIIGSKAYEYDFSKESIAKQSSRPRNHECPKIVENLLFNPDLQLSPLIINNQHKKYTDITIRQVLILIDPAYKSQPVPVGLLSVINDLPLELTIEHNLEHIDIKSILEPIIVPDDITEAHIFELLKIIKSFKELYNVVVNIMDCSSNTCPNIYANNITTFLNITDNWIHITKPKCLIDDTELQYIPIIEFSKEKIKSDISVDDESLFTHNKINVRWINCKDDLQTISSMKPVVYINCPYSRNLYDYIIRLYKIETIEYSIFSINKLWAVTTYTLDYTINIPGFSGFASGDNPGAGRNVIVNFTRLSFEDFAKYWRYKEFKALAPFNYDYDFIIFCKFIDNFIAKYTNRIGVSYLGLNPSIVDFLKAETYEIFNSLTKYFPSDMKYLPLNYESVSSVSRESIKQYLIDNGVAL